MRRLYKNAVVLQGGDDGYTVLENGFLGVDGDRIDYLGETAPAAPYDEERDMAGTMLIPGLVNAHTHTPMTLLRGVGSDLPLQSWLFDTVFPIEDRLTPAMIRAGTELALLEMIATGTTSFTDMYMEPGETAEAVLASGMKANLCRPVQCFDPTERPEDNFRVRESLELFDRWHNAGNGRVKIDFCVHAEYTCTATVVKYYADRLRERRGNLHIHLSETKKEHDECVQKYGVTPTRWFADLGAFDCTALAAHCVWVTEEDMALMRERGVSAVHCPSSNMKLGSGFAPVPRMLALGLNVALGTDGAASNNNLNMLEELHLASLLHNGFTGDPTVMPADVTLRMATLNGARAQGRGDTGELRVGKKADFAALSLTAPHMRPCLDPLALAAYSAQGSDVVMTVVDGQILYDHGKFLTMDAQRVYEDADRAVRELYQRKEIMT